MVVYLCLILSYGLLLVLFILRFHYSAYRLNIVLSAFDTRNLFFVVLDFPLLGKHFLVGVRI